MKLHLIMPMGGKGSRFSEVGFKEPKPLIKINNKPFFYWATRSITKFLDVDLTYVVLKEHVVNFNIDQEIKKYFPEANIVVIDEVLNGAVLTCLEGIKNINDDLPIVFNDCDHMFICNDFYSLVNNDKIDKDGILLTFNSNEAKFSYLDIDENNLVKRTVEKEVISNHAICGVYFFRNKDIFKDSVAEYLKKCNYQEYFISGVYNIMIANNYKVSYIDTDVHVSFGTPDEYNLALNSKHFEDLR